MDELKEGLNYALGTKENEANWFPVNKLAKSSTHSREENSGDESSSFVNYTTDIPLNDLSPYISNTNTNTNSNKNKSDTSLKYLVNSPSKLDRIQACMLIQGFWKQAR